MADCDRWANLRIAYTDIEILEYSKKAGIRVLRYSNNPFGWVPKGPYRAFHLPRSSRNPYFSLLLSHCHVSVYRTIRIYLNYKNLVYPMVFPSKKHNISLIYKD